MPATRPNYIAKLVSADQLVKYQPVTDGRFHDQIVNRYIMPLRPTAEMSDPLDTIRTCQRVYRFCQREYNDRLNVYIHEYREVL